MSAPDALLTIKLEGPGANEGRLPLDRLTQVLGKIQLCVKRLGRVLSGEVRAVERDGLK